MTKTCRVVAILAIWLLFTLCFTAVVPQATAQNGTADPNAVYGHCWEGVHGLASAFSIKASHIFFVGRGSTMANVAGIVVLECWEFDGGGSSHIVDCPPGTPYSYCILNTNDGAGNHILLGVFELNSTTDPNAQYGGCATGSGFRQKSALLLEVVKDIRNVNAIVVTACRGFDGPGGTFQVPCPKGSFYNLMLQERERRSGKPR